MVNENHFTVSCTRRLKFLEVRYVFIAQSFQGQPMTIESSSLSGHVLTGSFLAECLPVVVGIFLDFRRELLIGHGQDRDGQSLISRLNFPYSSILFL
jgi:hypothetical protein